MDKITLITGASTGIGKALAEEFASNGHNLLLVARTQSKLDALKTALENKYMVKVYVYVADLCQGDACEEVISYVEDQQLELEYLINNAGMGDAGLYVDSDWEKDEAIIRLNILALMRMCRLALPIMRRKQSGTIVNIGSTLSFAPTAGEAVYSASKAFVLSFGQALYEEMKGYGVRVLTVCPGVTATDFFTSAGFHMGSFQAATPEDFASFAYRQIKKGKALSVHRFRNQATSVFSRLAPRGVVRRIFAAACNSH